MVSAHSESTPPRLISGKYVLLVVVALGFTGAAGGWWYQQSLQRRPLKLWGQEAASLILRANDVELCRLEQLTNGLPSPNAVIVNGKSYRLVNCTNATRVRGFLHLRHSLLNDYSFNWNDAASGDQDWRYVLRFREGDQTVTLLLSADFNYVILVDAHATASIKPIAGAVREVVKDVWR